MSYSYEKDRLQCTAKNRDGTRCRLVGTHSNGKGVLCQRHHQLKQANDAQIARQQRRG